MGQHRRRRYRRRDGTEVAETVVNDRRTRTGSDRPSDQQRTELERIAQIVDEAAFAPRPARRLPKPYHLRFTNFDRRTIEATKTLFQSRPHSQPPARQFQIMRRWIDNVSDIYKVPAPRFRLVNEDLSSVGGGFYHRVDRHQTGTGKQPGTGEIVMDRMSLMTLMHEFRHHLQHEGEPMVRATHGDGSPRHEEDARAWSMSIFHQVAPVRFERLARERKIAHVEPWAFSWQPAADLDGDG